MNIDEMRVLLYPLYVDVSQGGFDVTASIGKYHARVSIPFDIDTRTVSLIKERIYYTLEQALIKDFLKTSENGYIVSTLVNPEDVITVVHPETYNDLVKDCTIVRK